MNSFPKITTVPLDRIRLREEGGHKRIVVMEIDLLFSSPVRILEVDCEGGPGVALFRFGNRTIFKATSELEQRLPTLYQINQLMCEYSLIARGHLQLHLVFRDNTTWPGIDRAVSTVLLHTLEVSDE